MQATEHQDDIKVEIADLLIGQGVAFIGGVTVEKIGELLYTVDGVQTVGADIVDAAVNKIQESWDALEADGWDVGKMLERNTNVP